MKSHCSSFCASVLCQKISTKETELKITSSQPGEFGTAGLYFRKPRTTTDSSKYLELFQDKPEIHMHMHGCSAFMHNPA